MSRSPSDSRIAEAELDALPQLPPLDVAVVGGGPAGTSCALTLRTHVPELRVALIETTAFDTRRLGENVSGALLPLLDYLDVRKEFLAHSAPVESFTLRAFWGSALALPHHSLRHWAGEGYLLDRNRFDVMLAEAVCSRGGKLYLSCRVEAVVPDSGGEGHRLLVRHASGQRFVLNARVVVDATGRNASVARRLGARSEQHDALIGVSRTFEMAPGETGSHGILIESAEQGWWYSAPLPDERLVVTWMTDATTWRQRGDEPLHHWSALLRASRNTWERTRAACAADERLTVRQAHTQLLDPIAGAGWLAAGDAAVSFDPLSSLGIGFSMHCACHAARTIAAILDDPSSDALHHYTASIRQQFASYRPVWQQYYRAETRFPESSFWKTRHGSGSQ